MNDSTVPKYLVGDIIKHKQVPSWKLKIIHVYKNNYKYINFDNDFNNKIRYVTVVVDNDSYPPSEISEFVVCKYYEKV